MPAELAGLEAFASPCATLPDVLSTDEALALHETYQAALALPTPEERDAALRINVLEPLAQRDQLLRTCAIFERRRADGLLSLGARFNQIVRDGR